MFGLFADTGFRPDKLCVRYFGVQVLVIRALKREHAAEQSKQQHACSPDVSRSAEVLFFVYNFWGHVGGRPAEHFEQCILARLAAEPKVDQLNDSLADDNVFKLDVPVSYLAIVQVDQNV